MPRRHECDKITLLSLVIDLRNHPRDAGTTQLECGSVFKESFILTNTKNNSIIGHSVLFQRHIWQSNSRILGHWTGRLVLTQYRVQPGMFSIRTTGQLGEMFTYYMIIRHRVGKPPRHIWWEMRYLIVLGRSSHATEQSRLIQSRCFVSYLSSSHVLHRYVYAMANNLYANAQHKAQLIVIAYANRVRLSVNLHVPYMYVKFCGSWFKHLLDHSEWCNGSSDRISTSTTTVSPTSTFRTKLPIEILNQIENHPSTHPSGVLSQRPCADWPRLFVSIHVHHAKLKEHPR
jgi:hypothetical protein